MPAQKSESIADETKNFSRSRLLVGIYAKTVSDVSSDLVSTELFLDTKLR